MHESEPAGQTAVGPAEARSGAQEASVSGQLRAAILNLDNIDLQRRCHRCAREIGASHRSRLQELSFVLAQAHELPVDQLAQVVGHAGGQLGDRAAQAPAGGWLDQIAPAHQVIDHGHRKQCIALGAVVDKARQLVRKRWGAPEFAHPLGGPTTVVVGLGALIPGQLCRGLKAPAQVVGQCRRGQPLKRQDAGLAAQAQVLGQAEQGVVPGLDLTRAQAGNDHQSCRVTPARQVGHHVQAGAVAPVQVFEPQHDGPFAGQRLQRLCQLAQHALCGGVGRRPTQCGRIGGVGQPGQLHQPGRGVAFKRLAQVVGADLPGQLLQRLQDRQVGLTRAVLIDATALDRPQLAGLGMAGHEGLDQRRLANPGLATDEYQLAPASAGRTKGVVQLLQFGLATHQPAAWQPMLRLPALQQRLA